MSTPANVNVAEATKLFAEAQKLIEQAASKLDTALLKLDVSYAECTCCRRRTYHNWDHARIYERMSNKPSHLMDVSKQIDEHIARLANRK